MIDTLLDIILVEDNPDDIEMALDALQEHNLANRVKVLRDGDQAVNYIFHQGEFADCGICECPAVILLDIHLPKIDGLEILRRIRSNDRTKNIRVEVFISTPADKERIESHHLDVNGYILKGIIYDDFAKAVSMAASRWTASAPKVTEK
jgi:two-component system, response regulator